MKTFSINTLGCKVNQYESQQIRQMLEAHGLRPADPADRSIDLIIINTCCVTHTASAKSRQCAQKARKNHPDAAIVFTGCLTNVEVGELRKDLGINVHLVKEKAAIAQKAAEIFHLARPNEQYSTSKKTQNSPVPPIKAETAAEIKSKKRLQLPQLTAFTGQTRAFLKVQDGCDGFCAYCIIPKTRPLVSSKPAEQVVSEAKALVKAGHKEIVITVWTHKIDGLHESDFVFAAKADKLYTPAS